MNEDLELKDAYVGAQVSKRQKHTVQKWCRKRDMTMSQWIRGHIENLDSEGFRAHA
jgi:hypothetical protein